MYLSMHQATHFLDRSPAHKDGRLAAVSLTTLITGGPTTQDGTLDVCHEAVDAQTEQIKQEIRSLGEDAREQAYMIEEHGLTIGEKGQQLFTGGAADWEAPKVHPVWAPEVAYEARRLQAIGEATFMYELLEELLQQWHDAGKPIIVEDSWQRELSEVGEYATTNDGLQITPHDRTPIDPFDWPTQAEQQAYEDRPYDLMEDRAHAADEC